MSSLEVALIGGVVGAVATAASQGAVSWVRRPRLELEQAAGPGPPEAVIVDHPADRRAAYIRLPVSNRGRRSAREVSVLVVAVRALDGPDAAPNISTLPLKWAEVDAESVDIPPKVWRLVDIAHSRCPDLESRLGLIPQWTTDQRRLLKGGHYELTLAVVAADVTARFWRLELVFPTAEWTGEEVWSEFRIEGLRRLRRV